LGRDAAGRQRARGRVRYSCRRDRGCGVRISLTAVPPETVGQQLRRGQLRRPPQSQRPVLMPARLVAVAQPLCQRPLSAFARSVQRCRYPNCRSFARCSASRRRISAFAWAASPVLDQCPRARCSSAGQLISRTP
jgi:hypothetical protein